MLRTLLLWVLGIFFVLAGWNHFHSHATYVAIMPPFLPWPPLLVEISGIAEIAGGLGVLIPYTRYSAGIGLIALLIAVFPANIYMAVDHVEPGGWHVPIWALWLRLPLQGVLIAWVWWVALHVRQSRRDLNAGTSAV